MNWILFDWLLSLVSRAVLLLLDLIYFFLVLSSIYQVSLASLDLLINSQCFLVSSLVAREEEREKEMFNHSILLLFVFTIDI